MVRTLSVKFQKPVAWMLFFTFYLELGVPLAAFAFDHRIYNSSYYGNPYISPVKNLPVAFGNERVLKPAAMHPESATDTTILHNDIRKSLNLPPLGGPGQPEMQSFQSVNTSNMVDLFTGDFSYNIPLMDVGGYPINIHYTGGISMDQEASWVGLGWNVNPGTVSRTMRGLPDDFDGTDSIVRTQHVKPNKTAGVTVGGDFELFGLPLNVGASLGVFKNNYNGWGIETGINASINSAAKGAGQLSGSLSLTNNSQTGLNVSPSLSVNLGDQDNDMHGQSTLSTNFNSRTGISALQLSTEVRSNVAKDKEWRNTVQTLEGSVPVTASLSFAVPSYVPTISMPYTSTQYAFTVKVGFEAWGGHQSGYLNGYVSQQEIKSSDVRQALPAFGYMYYTKANNRANALLDVNREKETQFNANTSPMIAIPQYTYDIYSISGEGTGGSFRPYRSEIGYMKDHEMQTKSANYNFSADVGLGSSYFHVGTDFIPVHATTKTNGWESSSSGSINRYIAFRNSDTSFQEVYFRNPGEKTSNTDAYYHSVGGDTLMRIKLSGSKDNITAANAFTLIKNAKTAGEISVTAPPVKTQRDKRTQLISYLTADEARHYGLDTIIKSYSENSVPLGNCLDSSIVTRIPRVDGTMRKRNHISEIDVTNADGRRYIYGLPAYNVEEKDVTFSVDKETNEDNINKGLVSYTPGVDNSTNNNKGKDSYYTQDSIPAYAHDFLLTGILSPDYVDVTGDGITPDDLGDAVKFNYSRVYGTQNGYYGWRTPMQANVANYNEGLKTYSRDDKGTYMYGKKEVWYLNSIESKTMIAVFKISGDRLDDVAVLGENGGLDSSKPLRKLDEIDLYAKADLVTNGANAKPIKSVHFVYSYSLCKGFDPNHPAQGKLTLDSIWFSYNRNYKGRINPYVFHYSPDTDGNPQDQYNPSYNAKNYDRWGNYKDPESNPGGMNNADYPYSVQDSATAAQNAAAWDLTDIQLPSSGKLKITYESDDYAYVQNRRACDLFKIAGFGNSPSSTPVNYLYDVTSKGDYYYLFVNSSVSLTDINDLKAKYLGNGDTVYFKVAVKMPDDMWGTGYEFVPGYAEVEDMGIVTGNPNRFWLKLQAVTGESPVSRAALEFLRLNLPSKAYPGSEDGNDLDFKSAVTMLASGFKEIANVINGFDNQARKKNECSIVDTTRSFIRLSNPFYRKYGGGHRVKRVELFDNWNKMTGQKEASYGQEYSYTTTEEVNGIPVQISSGVASYEPAIGNDENPFREPIEYAEKLAPLAPVNYTFVEQPVGESFFPSASVGYSRVVVRTINYKAKSANGWDETTFYTTKDFPTLVEYTVLDGNSKKTYKPVLSNLLKINARNYLTLSQGFKVELNDMNGKMKSEASYPETDSLHPVKATYYFYKEDDPNAYQKHLNNTVPVVDSLNGHINENGTIGKDIEVMTDLREQTSKTISMQISPNVDVIPFIFGIPLPIPSVWPLPQKEETRFRSAATVKIIQRYGILDSVVVIDKGSVVSTKNLVYDSETGDVIVSRTNNEFNDPVYNFNYPAYWAYSGMGPAYQNTDDVFYGKNIECVNGKLYNAADRSDFPMKRFFESGDELWVHSQKNAPEDPGCSVLHPDLTGVDKKLWVIDAAKAGTGSTGLYIIDAAGVPYTGAIDSIKITRSGKRNMSSASAGSIVSLADPVREVSAGDYKIVIDSNTEVINTSATVYKDLWKVENTLFQKDTILTVYDTITVSPSITITTLRRRVRNNYDETATKMSDLRITQNSHNIVSSFQGVPTQSCFLGTSASVQLYGQSVIYFDTSAIPAGAQVISANLDLAPRIPFDYWPQMKMPLKPCNSGFKSYDYFHDANNYYLNSSASTLGRITADWNYFTPYTSFQVSSLHKVSVDYNNYLSLDCSTLLQDMIDNHTKYGMMFQLAAHPNGVNYLDFCAGTESNINNINGSGCGDLSFNTSPAPSYLSGPVNNASTNDIASISCDCQKPVLTVTYRYPVDTIEKVCRPNISDTATNPYKWGILGNWRVDRAYTYYSDRTESDASSPQTNIRKEGTLKSFTPFWELTDSVMLPAPDTTKWVWNSAFSMYNRRGFEIENYDPLGRYNSGLYGYNETLPVAVAQNSKYRELLYDGFEDYSYQTQTCTVCASPREYDFTTNNNNVSVSDSQSHTGLYSLKINQGDSAVLTVPVSPDTTQSHLNIKVDTSVIYTTTVTGKGTGLTGKYYGYHWKPSVCGTNYTFQRVDSTINFSWGNEAPYPGLCSTNYTATWTGFIQAPKTGNFTFYAQSDFTVSVQINGHSFTGYRYAWLSSGTLVAGNLYPITVQYTYANSGNANVKLYWYSSTLPMAIVPYQFLYPADMTASDSAGSVSNTVVKYCIDSVNVTQANMIRPVFSPVQGRHIVISGWVRIDAADCNSIPALDNVIHARFDDDAHTSLTLQRTGVRIEGWQRYEGDVTVPAGANNITLSITAPSSYNIFLDDIRVQPFNSSMKSFVYNPVNLRLMAELDENNYASFYEYDDDGTLTRVKKETERGIKTIQETRSALIKDNN